MWRYERVLTPVRGGVWQPVEAGPFCTPIFCATENAPVRRWKRAPGGLAPWTPCVPLDETTSPGGNQESTLFLLSLPLHRWKCRRFSFYRFLSVDVATRLPCVRGAAPVRTLGLRGCNRSTESDETAGEDRRHPGLFSSASSAKSKVPVTTLPVPVCGLVPPPLTQGRLWPGAFSVLPLKQGEDRAGIRLRWGKVLAVGSSYDSQYRIGIYISTRIAAATGKAETVPHFHPVAIPGVLRTCAAREEDAWTISPLHLRTHWSRTDNKLSLFTIQKTVFSL